MQWSVRAWTVWINVFYVIKHGFIFPLSEDVYVFHSDMKTFYLPQSVQAYSPKFQPITLNLITMVKRTLDPRTPLPYLTAIVSGI